MLLCTMYNGAPYFKKSSLCVYFNVLALNYIVGKYVIYERKICPIVRFNVITRNNHSCVINMFSDLVMSSFTIDAKLF